MAGGGGGGGGNLVEVKFRLDDGSDIGPSKFSPATTVTTLKEKIIAQWPREKENGPKIISSVKLINAGKILENHWTLADAILPLGDLPGAVITMHVVVRPPTTDKKSGNVPMTLFQIYEDAYLFLKSRYKLFNRGPHP